MIRKSIYKIKNRIKKYRYSSNAFVRWSVEALFSIVRIAYTIKGFLTSQEARAVFKLKIFNSDRVHQTTTATCMNRFPIIFSACKEYYEGKDNIKILSFGCSTGEEVLTLRYYFPTATIVGAEINEHSLNICKKRKLDEKVQFINSTKEELENLAPFDVIFCMAVFQRTPGLIAEKNITNLKKIYPFEKFEKQIIELDNLLKEGGMMVVHFSQYDLLDTEVSSKYKVYGNYNQDNYGPYIFDKDSKLVQEKIKRYSIFIKDAV